MTDDMERYYYWKDGNWEQINDECTTNNFYTLEQCANELNRLNEENEELKKQNKRLEEKIQKGRSSFIKTQERYSKEAEAKIKELTEENEQLKNDVARFRRNFREMEEVKCELAEENENTKSILDDFMWILNVLQANPNDTKRLGVARDMLQNMGVLLYDK